MTRATEGASPRLDAPDPPPGPDRGPPGTAHRVGLGIAIAVLTRSAWFIATLMGAVFLIQLLLWAAPGDPIDLLPNGDELRPALEAEWGLDRPLLQRFGLAISRAATGDLGTSLTIRPGASVADLAGEAAKRSARLLLPGLLVAVGAGLALAWLTAGRAAKTRRLVQALSVPPVFLLAYLLVVGINELTFSLVQAGTIARPDWFALPDQPSLLRSAIAVAVLAIGSGSLTEIHSSFEDELVRIRSSAYVEAAIARGAPTWPHVLRNLLPPLMTIASSRVAFLVGGLVILEKVLMLNGGGSLLWEACLRRDYPLAMGLTLAAALAVCLARLLADLVRIVVDPRLREHRA